jgi:hypothetical protein
MVVGYHLYEASLGFLNPLFFRGQGEAAPHAIIVLSAGSRVS